MVHDLDSSTVNSKIDEDNPYGYRDSETTFGFVRRKVYYPKSHFGLQLKEFV